MEEIRGLIEKARQGDSEAFGEILGRYQDMAVGYAWSITGDFHYAQDAAQEAFTLAYLNIKKLKESEAFGSWLRRIVFSSCGRITRRRKFNTTDLELIEEISGDEDSTFQEVHRRSVKGQISEALRSLPDEQYQVAILYYMNDCSYKEIADFMGMPVSTVNNRLHSAKQKIKRELFEVFEENIKTMRVSRDNEFKRKVIEGICRIGFQPAENMGPENIPFASIMRVCMEHLKEDYGYETIPEANLRINNAYTFFMGTSGAAFRFFWNWSSRTGEGGRMDSIFLEEDPTSQIEGAMEAAGYDYELVFSSNAKSFNIGKGSLKNKPYIKKKILESINSHKPVIGLGVVGPSEWSIITGYDEDGEVLTGWSYFQDEAESSLGFEPCGYFRKRDWFDDTAGIVIIGDKKERPDLGNIYSRTLKIAVETMEKHDIKGVPTGFNAYEAWSRDILNDENFPADDESMLQSRYSVQVITCLELAERRWYGMKFLEKIPVNFPEMAEELGLAWKCFKEEHDMMWSILELMGGFMDPEGHLKLSSRDTRLKISEIILRALEKDREAAECLAKATEKSATL